jgi:hypothetical protein
MAGALLFFETGRALLDASLAHHLSSAKRESSADRWLGRAVCRSVSDLPADEALTIIFNLIGPL